MRGRAVLAYQDGNSYFDYVSQEKPSLYGVLEADLTPSTLLTVGASYGKVKQTGDYAGLPRFTVQRRLFLAHVIEIGVAVLVGQHRAAAHAALGVQRSGHIDFGAALVPAAGRQRHIDLGLGQRLLAHQVDDAARIAHAAQQARGAAHDFDAGSCPSRAASSPRTAPLPAWCC